MPSKKIRHLFRGGLSVLVILFFVWHVVAIGIYAIPSIAQDPFSIVLRTTIDPMIRPYILLTSQWQQWNLFAPDPLRRVTHYHLQRFDPTKDMWTDVMVFQPGTFPWWKHATRFKILDRIFDLESQDQKIPLQKHFLAKMCHEFSLPSGTRIRMFFRYYVIPNSPNLISFSWWKSWQPTWYTIDGPQISCP